MMERSIAWLFGVALALIVLMAIGLHIGSPYSFYAAIAALVCWCIALGMAVGVTFTNMGDK